MYFKENTGMAKRKYEELFISGPRPEDNEPSIFTTIAHLEDKRIKGSFYYYAHVMPVRPDVEPGKETGHGPHIHKNPELMMHFGMNPDDPFDLGAEIEFCMGPEMESYKFNKSTVVYIPANFIHCPWFIRKQIRPFLLIQVHQGPTHTEKSYRQIVPKELRERLLFIDEGYGGESIHHIPKAMKEAREKLTKQDQVSDIINQLDPTR
jgi:hypothetical protein